VPLEQDDGGASQVQFLRFPPPTRDDRFLTVYYPLDPSSLLAVQALRLQPDDHVLDLCAAPGGKSLAILQYLHGGSGRLTCNDPAPDRRRRLNQVVPRNLISEDSDSLSLHFPLPSLKSLPFHLPSLPFHLPSLLSALFHLAFYLLPSSCTPCFGLQPSLSFGKILSFPPLHHLILRFVVNQVLRDYIPEEDRKRVTVTAYDGTKGWHGTGAEAEFDKVLLDAPCSTERHVLHKPSELSLWRPGRSKSNAERQVNCARTEMCIVI